MEKEKVESIDMNLMDIYSQRSIPGSSLHIATFPSEARPRAQTLVASTRQEGVQGTGLRQSLAVLPARVRTASSATGRDALTEVLKSHKKNKEYQKIVTKFRFRMTIVDETEGDRAH